VVVPFLVLSLFGWIDLASSWPPVWLCGTVLVLEKVVTAPEVVRSGLLGI
jgi:hypothetical protein